MSKPDSTRAEIVAAIRAAGASVIDHEGRKGEPDLVVGYRGRMWFVELKTPGKEHGVCGCDHVSLAACERLSSIEEHVICDCTGHLGTGNAERTTWHAQLAFAEAWQGPRVLVWTTVEQALRDIGAAVGPGVPTFGPALTAKIDELSKQSQDNRPLVSEKMGVFPE